MTTSNLEEPFSVQKRIQSAIDTLPVLTKEEVASLADDACPICLVPFLALGDATTGPSESTITKILGCGHVFCKNDLTEWIRGRHGSCPSCRHPFLDIKPPSESDDESSDGGEYLPPSDDFEDEDDGFLDTDGFTDAEAEGFIEDNTEAFNEWDDDVAVMEDLDVDLDFGGEDPFDVEYEECSLIEGDSGTISDTTSLEIDSPVDFLMNPAIYDPSNEGVEHEHEAMPHDTSESKQ